MMKRILLASVATAVLALSGAPVYAAKGLDESVWHDVPYYAFVPDAGTINQEQAWAAASTPAYTFLNSVDGFNYSNSNFGGGASTVAAWFGADAAGAALTDVTNPGSGFFSFDAKGYIYAPVAGTYSFNLGDTYNAIDDAARVTVDGAIVAQQNFGASLTPYATTLDLSAGFHSFDLFYLQTLYGYGLNLSAIGPNGGAVIYTTTNSGVPELSTWAMLLTGFAGLGIAGYRRKAALAA